MKTSECRLPKIDANGEQIYSVQFSKADADALMSCLDVTLKSAGLPAAQAVTLWCDKVRDAMSDLAPKT
jgi:hypothetical protein